MIHPSVYRVLFFTSVLTAFISAWDMAFLKPLKNLVVLFHESGHAIATLITGGNLKSILIHSGESGKTIAVPQDPISFIAIVSAGYIGSSLIGGFMVREGFSKSNSRTVTFFVGIILLFLTHFYGSNDLTYSTGIFWGIIFLGFGISGKDLSSLFLVFIGCAVSLYSLFDLADFIRSVQNTDAGLLAKWILIKKNANPGSDSIRSLGYWIAGIWACTSSGILAGFIFTSFHHKFTPVEKSIFEITKQVAKGKVKPDVAEWFLQRGIDFDGKPLPKQLLTEIKKQGKGKV